MGVYDRQRATALRLIKKYGELCKFKHTANVNTDNASPWLGGTAVTNTYDVHIAFFSSNSQISHLVEALGGTSIPTGSLIGYMPPVQFNPSITDTVTRKDGSVYRVKSIDPLRPNDETTILYTLEFEE